MEPRGPSAQHEREEQKERSNSLQSDPHLELEDRITNRTVLELDQMHRCRSAVDDDGACPAPPWMFGQLLERSRDLSPALPEELEDDQEHAEREPTEIGRKIHL